MTVPEGLDELVRFELTEVTPSHDVRETATILFLAHRHYVKAVALRYAPLAHLADEAVQQVFMKFIDNAEKWDYSGNLKTLLAVMAQNIAQDIWRSESRHFQPNFQRVAEHVRQLLQERDTESYADELKALEQCLNKMPEKSKILIQMHYFDGIPMREIAEKLGLNPDSVYQAFSRLRGKLRQCIEQVTKEAAPNV